MEGTGFEWPVAKIYGLNTTIQSYNGSKETSSIKYIPTYQETNHKSKQQHD